MKTGYKTAIAAIVALTAIFLPAAAVRAEDGSLVRFGVTVKENACVEEEGVCEQSELAASGLAFPSERGENGEICVRFEQKSWIYREKRIEPPNHESAYEMRFNRVNAPLKEKAALVASRVRAGWSKKKAIAATFPLIAEFLKKAASEVYVAPTDSEMEFCPSGKNTFVVRKEKAGVKVDERAFYCDFYLALKNGFNREITLKTTPVEPNVTASDQLSQTFLRARFSTDYSRSGENRRHNVELALKKINGVTLQSGQSFSFNRTVGARTEKNGFRQAKIIVGGDYVDGTGGGGCQVSTTLYNAVLLADLNVDEADSHSLPPSYVKPSFDAAVNFGSRDLKFTNGTDGKIFIRAYSDGGRAVVEIYGKKNRYRIERKSVVVKTGEAPPDRIITDDENKYFLPEEESGTLMRIRSGVAGVTSEGYLLYYENGKLVKTRKIRSDKYLPVKGILVKKP